MAKFLNNESVGFLLKVIVNLLSVLVFIIFLMSFFGAKINYILSPVITLYISLLSIYATNKEFARWKERYKSRYSGELFVYFWTIIIFTAIIISLFSSGKFIIPDPIITAYIAIITIFAITKQSKTIFEKQKE